MKCPNCGFDMTASGSGWLCLNCGHLQTTGNAAGSDSSSPAPATTSTAVPPLRPTPMTPTPGAPAEPSPNVALVPPPVTGTWTPPSAATPTTGGAPMGGQVAPRHTRRRLWISVVAVVLVLLLGAAGVYAYAVAPQAALTQYLQRLTGAKTSTFAATVAVQTSDGYHVALNLSGRDDLTSQAKPKLDLSLTGKLSAASGAVLPGTSSGGSSLSGSLRLIDKTVYFKIGSLSLLSQFLPIQLSNDWYKYDFSGNDTAKQCMSQSGSGNLLGSSILTTIPVKDTAFKGLESVNGTQSLHYAGTIDKTKLQAAIDHANKHLSADCQLDVTADDYKNLTVTYELWRGWSKDRLKVHLVDASDKSTSDLTLDSSAYDKPVTIDAPTGAKDISEILKQLEASFGGEDDTSAPAATPAGRDVQRKTDIVTIRKGLEEYFVNNNHYPKNLTELTLGSAPIIETLPTDPLGKAPYAYTYTPGGSATGQPQTYRLDACLEDATATGTDVIKPVPPCTTKTFEVVNGN